MIRTKREYFTSDIRKLREIATQEALLIIFLSQNKDLFFEVDGRKRRSKKYKAAQRFRNKELRSRLSNSARKIYQAWKYLGVDCVRAGRLYQTILERKVEQFKDINLSITGDELTWETMLIETPKATRFKRTDSFYYQLYSLKIDAVA